VILSKVLAWPEVNSGYSELGNVEVGGARAGGAASPAAGTRRRCLVAGARGPSAHAFNLSVTSCLASHTPLPTRGHYN